LNFWDSESSLARNQPAEAKTAEEFDTSLLSMTVIPIVGFWKLLPTVGGCVVTVSNITLVENTINMEVMGASIRNEGAYGSRMGHPFGQQFLGHFEY
jgi:hypothetical protein